ncbi:MAG: intradiol ring-cleavage dioxygenase [Dehalococcoidia bacterium]
MDNDDRPVGRILSRREVLTMFGGLGLAAIVGCAAEDDSDEATATAATTATEATAAAGTASLVPTATSTTATSLPACVVVPERTEGPYFVDGQMERSDLVEDREGVPLAISVNVVSVGDGCTPIEGAIVDVWHCDALGVYSGVSDPGFDTAGQTFLRGWQRTDADGVARFSTIYPGWYSGRTVHIHYKVRTTGADGADYEMTSQWFFDEGVSDAVFATEPYAGKGQRDTTNATDGIFATDGDVLTLALNGDPQSGYETTFDLGLDLSDSEVGASDSAGGAGSDGRPGPGA